MSLQACAALVERADPDRFLATMAAPPDARRILFPLYAFNAEVARAPWVTEEPMIAEMRLQWWRDAVEEIANVVPVRAHEVATPLSEAISPDVARVLDTLIAARRWDVYSDPFEDQDHFLEYIDQTSGALLWAAAHSLGPCDEQTVRHAGFAQGVANWFLAIPDLENRNRIPLVDGRPDGVRTLARDALTRLAIARANRAGVSAAARPAMLAIWEAETILKTAVRAPQAVGYGALRRSPAGKRLSLMARAATGRW